MAQLPSEHHLEQLDLHATTARSQTELRRSIQRTCELLDSHVEPGELSAWLNDLQRVLGLAQRWLRVEASRQAIELAGDEERVSECKAHADQIARDADAIEAELKALSEMAAELAQPWDETFEQVETQQRLDMLKDQGKRLVAAMRQLPGA